MITEQELEDFVNARLEEENPGRAVFMETKPVWLCDIRRNTSCRKTGCVLNGGPCMMTAEPAYAWHNKAGKPVPGSEELQDWLAAQSLI